jgi:hypothetical protein
MNSTHNPGRVAGFYYLLPCIVGPLRLVYIPTKLFVRGGDFLSVFDKPQRDALAMLFIKLRDHQNTAAEILWGVWLLPLAALVYKRLRTGRISWLFA